MRWCSTCGYRMRVALTCRQLRQAGSEARVLMATAQDTVEDRVLGLDLGADDYLVKP